MNPDVFFNTYAPIAIDDSIYSGIPPSIKLAQAALESGWGTSGLTTKANNFFGIKATNWSGPVYSGVTHEYYNSTPTTITANFRAYKSPYHSFMDHSELLTTTARYAPLFKLNKLDYKAWAHGLQNAGYATSPTYATKLIALIDKYNLQQYDIKAQQLKSTKTLAAFIFIIAFVFLALTLLKIVKF